MERFRFTAKGNFDVVGMIDTWCEAEGKKWKIYLKNLNGKYKAQKREEERDSKKTDKKNYADELEEIMGREIEADGEMEIF